MPQDKERVLGWGGDALEKGRCCLSILMAHPPLRPSSLCSHRASPSADAGSSGLCSVAKGPSMSGRVLCLQGSAG